MTKDDATYIDLVAENSPAFAAALRAQRQGDLAAAHDAYLKLVELPDLTAASLHQLGMIAGEQGDTRRGARLVQNAVRIDPEQPLFIRSFATLLTQLGQREKALTVLVDLGCLWQKFNRHDEAARVFREILAAAPDHYEANANLGASLAALGQSRQAIPFLLRAVALHAPTMPELKLLLDAVLPRLVAEGVAPLDIGRPAMPAGQLGLVQHVLTTLGKALADLGDDEDALLCYRLAIDAAPGFALAHFNLSTSLLRLGDFAAGWPDYEWRWRWDQFRDPRRILPAPLWRGEPLAGKTVVVYAEQGYGDAIQFAPLAARLAGQADRVLFEVTTPLLRLFREGFAVRHLEAIERTSEPHRIETAERYDYVVPLMSLPARLGLALGELPLARAYIAPPAMRRAPWRDRLGGPGFKIGLAWLGRSKPDPGRSIPLERLRPLFEREGVSWHALQRVGETAEIEASGLPIADWSREIGDFADTAALIAELDLVISIDTAAAHLAGALGKPVWIALPANADWRWFRDREDCPWYPSARLFRKKDAGSWDEPVARLGDALAALIAAEKPPVSAR
jgi:tetratricopeptide (TPR) repeat protein